MRQPQCRFCGAPQVETQCLYCGAGFKPEEEPDPSGFDRLMKQFRSMDTDNGRGRLARTLANSDRPFTAGQVRAFAQITDTDRGKLEVFRGLYSRIVNPADLLYCGDIFDTDNGRSRLLNLIEQNPTRVALRASKWGFSSDFAKGFFAGFLFWAGFLWISAILG